LKNLSQFGLRLGYKNYYLLGERKKMKKAMISQPMAGKTDKEIVETRNKAIKVLTEKGYEVINTLFTDEWYSKENMTKRGVVQVPLCFLAKSLENMSLCHTVYFCKGWENARGCKIEHDAAVAYGLEIIYEEEI
jgi:SLT domain-containing protein